MSKSSKGEGTKIAQAAKDLNVASVTIRRWISEFNLQTAEDENGIKVLPARAMDELQQISKLRDKGLAAPDILESLEEYRAKEKKSGKKEAPVKKTAKRAVEAKKDARKPVRGRAAKDEDEDEDEEEESAAAVADDDDEDEEQEAPKPLQPKRAARRISAPKEAVAAEAAEQAPRETEADADETEGEASAEAPADGRSKHTLTCQTCTKTFEHLNPRLRDCLDCYRAKRKERRRGGDKSRNVIAHPLAQQVADKQQQRSMQDETVHSDTFDVSPTAMPVAASHAPAAQQPLRMSTQRINPLSGMKTAGVRNYRKAIEDTRQITTNLKRRLERPDLPENERRWLEQIYAYQLILHQGWRHLAEYKAGNPPTRDRGEAVAAGEHRDRGERDEREEGSFERPERFDRAERGERPERGGERPDRGERGGRYGGGGGRDRDRYNRGGGRERNRGGSSERTGERPERPDREAGERNRETPTDHTSE